MLLLLGTNAPLSLGQSQARPLQVPRARSRAVEPDHLVLRPRKMRSGQRFSYLALEPEETRALNAAYHERIHRDQSNLIPLGSGGFHPNGSRTPLQRPLPPKRHGPGWPSPAADLPRSSLAPPSASIGKEGRITSRRYWYERLRSSSRR